MIFDDIKKFIFPSRCVVCDSILPYGHNLENEFLCDECRPKLEFIKEPTCKKCGAVVSNKKDALCIRCEKEYRNGYDYGFGLLRYNDFVKESMHNIKYKGRKEYIDFYGKMIAKRYKEKFAEISADYLVPVPIHKKRLRERNYNQAAILAYSISNELMNYGIDIPVNEDIVYRKKDTKVLNKLDNVDREYELSNAFVSNDLSDIEKIIIVDDIYTTGATIDKLAKVLKTSGVRNVYFVTITIVDNL